MKLQVRWLSKLTELHIHWWNAKLNFIKSHLAKNRTFILHLHQYITFYSIFIFPLCYLYYSYFIYYCKNWRINWSRVFFFKIFQFFLFRCPPKLKWYYEGLLKLLPHNNKMTFYERFNIKFVGTIFYENE